MNSNEVVGPLDRNLTADRNEQFDEERGKQIISALIYNGEVEKHDMLNHRRLLLSRRVLSSQDLKTLVAFTEHFGLDVHVRENLGGYGFIDPDQRGLVISISQPPLSF